MELTEELKNEIDKKSPYELLYRIRFSPLGEEIMLGESGSYWSKRYSEWKAKNPDAAVALSKQIGWDKC